MSAEAPVDAGAQAQHLGRHDQEEDTPARILDVVVDPDPDSPPCGPEGEGECGDLNIHDRSWHARVHIPPDAQPGDVLQPTQSARMSLALFVGPSPPEPSPSGRPPLLLNPDLSGSGYLSIPLVISRLFRNPIRKFRNLPWLSLDLSPDCPWLVQRLDGAADLDWTLTLFVDCPGDPWEGGVLAVSARTATAGSTGGTGALGATAASGGKGAGGKVSAEFPMQTVTLQEIRAAMAVQEAQHPA